MKRFGTPFYALLLSITITCAAQTKHPKQTQYINPPELSKPMGYSHAVVPSGKLVFIAGQVALNKQGELVGKDDFRAQAAQAFENVKTALASAGTTPSHIVKLNYYVVGLDGEKLKALREVRGHYLDEQHLPASTLAGVQALFRPDVMVEIEVTATLP